MCHQEKNWIQDCLLLFFTYMQGRHLKPLYTPKTSAIPKITPKFKKFQKWGFKRFLIIVNPDCPYYRFPV